MEVETSTLVLNTFDINSSVAAADYQTTIDNEYGSISSRRCNFTWKNIDLRKILGRKYDNYEMFNLCLYQVNQSQGFSASAPSTNPSLLVDIKMKGLPFLNNTYNVVSRNTTNTAYLTSYVLNNATNTGIGTVTQMANPTIVTFGKSTECVDINIDMKTTVNQQYPTMVGGTSFGTFIFLFKFYGVTTKPLNVVINGSRM